MKARTFGYCLKEGILNTFKNRLMSFASISTISACILVICLFFSVVQNIEYIIHDLENRIGVVVFFEDETSDERIHEIRDLLNKKTEIHHMVYTSAEEAWDNFRKDYFEGREELLVGFEDDNPLKDSASLQIFVNDINKQAHLVNYIKSLNNIRLVREQREVTDIMQGANELVKYLSVALISILIIISMFLISNTVRLAIELRKREINIMKYIGATDALIRLPFIIEGAIIGFIGAILPVYLVYRFYGNLTEIIAREFTMLGDFLIFLPVEDLLVQLVPLSLIIGMGIGMFGSMLTIHKHLRV